MHLRCLIEFARKDHDAYLSIHDGNATEMGCYTLHCT
jgi:hypothetical protein